MINVALVSGRTVSFSVLFSSLRSTAGRGPECATAAAARMGWHQAAQEGVRQPLACSGTGVRGPVVAGRPHPTIEVAPARRCTGKVVDGHGTAVVARLVAGAQPLREAHHGQLRSVAQLLQRDRDRRTSTGTRRHSVGLKKEKRKKRVLATKICCSCPLPPCRLFLPIWQTPHPW